VDDAQASRELLLAALENRHAIARDVVLLNAGAALYVAGLVGDLVDGIACARAAIDSGAARARVDAFVAATRRLEGAA
jgi:anthranilate phosphoribosyltransferase